MDQMQTAGGLKHDGHVKSSTMSAIVTVICLINMWKRTKVVWSKKGGWSEKDSLSSVKSEKVKLLQIDVDTTTSKPIVLQKQKSCK